MSLFFKVLLVILLLLIMVNLAKAMLEMVKDPPPKNSETEQKPMSLYLGRRVLLSALTLVCLVILLLSGVIELNPRPY